jgi:cysteinyl-tRNA synthetase
MAAHYLGKQFDIHTGGVDHVAVHHTNEIAQSEHGFGVRPWVRFWLHGAWLLGSGEKLSKSAGSAPCLDDLEHWRVAPEAFRYYLLTAHYRAPLGLNLEALRAAQVAWTRLSRFACSDGEAAAPAALDPELRAAFDDALALDLDAPRAVSVLWQAVHTRRLSAPARRAHVRHFARALGLELKFPAESLNRESVNRHESSEQAGDDPHRAEIERLVGERQRARERRDFVAADQARHELAARGVTVVDTPGGPRWTRR